MLVDRKPLFTSVSLKEAHETINVLRKVVDFMKILNPQFHELEILETAKELGITAYEASYIVPARNNGLSLIMEDARLKDKVRKMVKAISVSDIL